jgi:hypothetical protein
MLKMHMVLEILLNNNLIFSCLPEVLELRINIDSMQLMRTRLKRN